MFLAILTDAFSDGDMGVCIRYRTGGKLFDLRWLQAKTKVHTGTINDFLFANDCAPNATADKFSEAFSNLGIISKEDGGDASASSMKALRGAKPLCQRPATEHRGQVHLPW